MDRDLTLSEAAHILGISRQRLAVIAQSGRIGRQVAGHYWIFTPGEVEAYKPNIHGRAGRPVVKPSLPTEHRTPAILPS